MQLTSIAETHTGLVRKENQDAFLERPDIGLFAVADGMGGHTDGALASQVVIERLDEITSAPDARGLMDEVETRLIEANRQLIELATQKGDNVVMASTVVVLLVHSNHFACAWVGDSRLYLLRNEALTRISRDHSQVQEMIDGGQITPEEAEVHPAQNVVTRAIGGDHFVEVEFTHGRLNPNDCFLLCSDGLTKMMSDKEITNIMNETPLEDTAHNLIGLSLERGATDNTTVVIVKADVTETWVL